MTNRLSLLRVTALNAIAGSVDLVLAVEGAYFVPAILNLGLSPLYGAMVLSLSPLLSIIFQGYLGSATDQCTCRWGRRRPFILGFSIAGLFGLLLFPFVQDIADVAGSSRAVLIPLVIMTTFVTDFFVVGSVQVPFRAYALDVLPQKQVVMGTIVYSICLSLGSAIGFGIGAVNWAAIFTSSDNFSLQLKFVFGLTFLITVTCVTITLFSVPEHAKLSANNPASLDIRQENNSTHYSPFQQHMSEAARGPSGATVTTDSNIVALGDISARDDSSVSKNPKNGSIKTI